MDLDDIKAHLDRLFAARASGSSRDQAAGLREALIEFKVALGPLRDALTQTERALAAARTDSDKYERRGRLAGDIGDAETMRIAAEFTAAARERVDLLERKVRVQQDELALAEREYEATKQRFQSASRGVPLDSGAAPGPSAEPGPSSLDAALLDQRAREAAVDAQLAMLKKKLGERQ